MGVRKVKWKRNDCTSHRTRIKQKNIYTCRFQCYTMEKLKNAVIYFLFYGVLFIDSVPMQRWFFGTLGL